MRITPNFHLEEWLASDKHPELVPKPHELSTEIVVNICRCAMVVQFFRDRFGPTQITSGYRTKKLNDAIPGSNDSSHLTGLAADCVFLSFHADSAWREICDGKFAAVPFDRIAYYPARGHFHVEATPGDREPRRLLFVADPSWQPVEADSR